MAFVHTEIMPKYKGENQLAQRLSKINCDRLHFWFSLDFIPGVKDIDILILHEDIGVFTVEVKAVPIEMIRSVSYTHCEIDGRDPDRGPTAQAYSAFQSLRNYLKSKVARIPFITATVCWPKINREDWNNHWDNEQLTGEYAASLIFREDVESTAEILVDRLKHIFRNPPIRSGGEPNYIRKEVIQELIEALNPKARPRPTMSDLQRLKAIEKTISSEIRKKVAPAEGLRVLLTGYPGTGKTFRLLQIGFSHSYEGLRVIFLCFNKTLGADIRRLLTFSDKLRLTRNGIDVFDVYQFASEYAAGENIGFDKSMDYDEWGQLVLEGFLQAKKRGQVEQYDTVLVDEAQDMQQWHLDLAHALGRDNATMCVAVGRGQELYGDGAAASKWLEAFGSRPTQTMRLNRNFRNTNSGFRFAWCFSTAYPDPNKIESALRRFGGSEFQMQFDRTGGGLPKLEFISEGDLPTPDDPSYPIFQEELMVGEFFRVISAEYQELVDNKNNRPIDLLILVPDTKSTNTQWVRAALGRLRGDKGIGFTDFVAEESRRDIAPDDKIRFSTFHSCRGLEGARVIIFGLERLPQLGNDIGVDQAKLGYIVLSRALFDVTIVIRQNLSNSVTRFLEKELYALSKL